MTSDAPHRDENYRVFELDDLESERDGERWYEFHRSRSQYSGLYVLPRGAVDEQTPHDHDELYFVLKGRACVLLGAEGERRRAAPGSIIYVKAGEEHRFCDIEEELHLLVFFSMAEPDRPGDTASDPNRTDA